jgi:hypothetical protein
LALQTEVMHELRPGAAHIGVLVDLKWPVTERFVPDVAVADEVIE